MRRLMSRRQATAALILVCSVVTLIAFTPENIAQERRRRARSTPRKNTHSADSSETMVTISYPDSVSLAIFVDYISQRLDLKIIYGDEVRNQTVVFRPEEVQVPQSQLLNLLRSMLRMRDLALVQADIDGWMRIVQSDDMQRHTTEFHRGEINRRADSSNRVITQIVPIVSEDMQAVLKYAKQFLSSGKASVIEVPEKKFVIITDYESAVARALEIIKLIDAAPVSTQIVSIPVEHYDAKTVADHVISVLADKATLEGQEEPSVTIRPSLTSGSILLIGAEEEIDQVRQLVERFDVTSASFRSTQTYAPKHISVDRLQRLIEAVIAREAFEQDALKMFVDEAVNRLYVTTSPAIHDHIRDWLRDEDLASMEASRPLRIYKPQNRLAGDLINILAEILPNVAAPVTRPAGKTEISAPTTPPGPNRPPAPAGRVQELPLPPAQQPYDVSVEEPQQVTHVAGDDFALSYDEHTNSLIAIGPREFHSRLQALIAELDQRQAQVLIEVTLVAITFNDSFSLGIELAAEDKPGRYQSLLFSSFGLSGIDLATGARTLNPGGGFNAVIIGPNETPILLRAIAAHGDSRVITTPKVVVRDNTTTTIRSVEESPFTSVNASDTVATTSFAGFESAGTTLTVTPHIAQGDHLTLEYNLNFSNFTGQGGGGVPPPRTTNSFSGQVEIPDSHTIIVGGLVTENESDSVTEVPFLGRIPVVGALFQSSNRARTKFRVYAFIRPTILRADQFEDLKLISRSELERAELKNQDYPESLCLWMR